MLKNIYSREFSELSDFNKNKIKDSWSSGRAVKIGALAKNFGLKVFESSDLPSGISGQIKPSEEDGSVYEIYVEMFESSDRKRFTVAHEIAHFLLHRELIGDGISDSPLFRSKLSNPIEAQANRLAADILMPSPLIYETLAELGKIGNEDRVEILSSKFAVSRSAIETRLKILTLLQQ